MSPKFKLFSLLIIGFFISLNNLLAQEELEITEVIDNLYAIVNPEGGNIAFLATRKGVVVIDAGSTPSNGKDIINAIGSVTKKPIKYLILTHSHGDHINGIAAFPNDITIIAHKNLATNNEKFNRERLNNYIHDILPSYLVNLKLQMGSIKNKESDEYIALKKDYNENEKYLEEIKNIKFRNPDITFEDYYRFKIADERIMLEFPGPCHTNDNIVVKFSNHNVIHTGDIVFYGSFPYMITQHGVDVYNWIKTLDDLYEENIYDVIPGHGELGRKVIIKDQADYFKDLSYEIEALKNAEYNLDEIKKRIKIDDFNLKGNENQFPINIEVIYTEIENKGVEWWKF